MRCTLEFFFNILDVAALAAYIIFKWHNPALKGLDQRRLFVLNIPKQICTKNIEKCLQNRKGQELSSKIVVCVSTTLTTWYYIAVFQLKRF